MGIGRAVPADRYTQAELHALNPWPASGLIDRLFLDSPVVSRGFVVPPSFYGTSTTLQDTNRAWRDGAMSLSGAALLDALDKCTLQPDAIDVLGVTTVTGYCTPGLDLLLAREHGLRPDLSRLHFNCIGCHAAVPLLRTVADHVARRPGSIGVAIAAEVCSACFRPDPDPQNIVALSLFGDGAAAAVVGTEGNGPILMDFASAFDFEAIDALGFDLTSTGFRIVLDPSVPDRIAAAISDLVDGLLRSAGVDRAEVSAWCFHPGGSRILDGVAQRLHLDDEAMLASRRVLRSHGNMSSPSVLFTVAEAKQLGQWVDGKYGVMAAFGPGLGIEAALLRFDRDHQTA